MFRARYRGDLNTLRFLQPKFIEVGNYAAALLCLDPAFLPSLPPPGTSTVDYGAGLSLHLAYFELLVRLKREDCLEAGSMRQKVFAFQPCQDDRFFVPANSLLYPALPLDGVQEKDGCIVTHEELRRTLDCEIPEYIGRRAKQQNNTYRKRLGAIPCLRMVVNGECTNPGCQSQHLEPERITASWFNGRVHHILREIQILNLAGFHSKGVILCV